MCAVDRRGPLGRQGGEDERCTGPQVADRTLSVNEVVDEINGVLRDRFRDGVWVQGEISNCKMAPSGHVYVGR